MIFASVVTKAFSLGYPENYATNEDISLEEEKIIVTELIMAQQIDYISIEKDMDFCNSEKIRPKFIRGFTKLFVCVTVLMLIVCYGLIQFIFKASEDEKLKPLVIIAAFSIPQCYHPPAQVCMYYWQSENMAKLVNQYTNTFRALSENPREFYRSLAIKRNIFKYFVRFGAMWLVIANFMFGNSYSNEDPRYARGTILPLWFPIETNYFPVREIFLMFLIFLAWTIVMLIVHQSIDAYILAQLFEYKCQIFIKLMKTTSLSRVHQLELVRKNFRIVVDFHQDLKVCFNLTRDILGGIFAPVLTVFIPITAALSTAFVKDFNLAYFLEFLAIVILCYMCMDSMQRITDWGDTIQQTAYDMDWYEMDRAMNKEYIIFLNKLQLPFELHSILFVMKKPMFHSMMKSVYSFFMLILQIN